jgi:hypothetical protein
MQVSGQIHVPTILFPGEGSPNINWIRGWVALRVSLEALEKIKELHSQESNLKFEVPFPSN